MSLFRSFSTKLQIQTAKILRNSARPSISPRTGPDNFAYHLGSRNLSRHSFLFLGVTFSWSSARLPLRASSAPPSPSRFRRLAGLSEMSDNDSLGARACELPFRAASLSPFSFSSSFLDAAFSCSCSFFFRSVSFSSAFGLPFSLSIPFSSFVSFVYFFYP